MRTLIKDGIPTAQRDKFCLYDSKSNTVGYDLVL